MCTTEYWTTSFLAASPTQRTRGRLQITLMQTAFGRPRWRDHDVGIWNTPLGWADMEHKPASRNTIGVEDELIRLHRADHSAAQSADQVFARLPGELTAPTSLETRAGVIELATRIHFNVKRQY